uniref:PKS-NRPS hybrid synthetase cheA-like n=1 Tax=Erigeron canadensis TaxID=72917 RepID=UPI001CB91BB1|nr:PKS-NRPS hybrid synthetase cheA-like [Erigeron canadensis]
MVEWAQNLARSQGYLLVTKRSKKVNGYLCKVVLMCDRGGVCKNSGDKDTKSKKIDCKFELVGRYYKVNDLWVLKVKCDEHNHEPLLFPEGHPYARRLTHRETCLVATMTSQNLKARDILATLKVLDENNVSTNRTIYNAQEKLRLIGHEDMAAFPDVLLIDATYNTNKFDMPLLEIVGVTSTSKTFSIAFVLLDRERTSNFIWALHCLKMCIGLSYTPRVIITDRDLGLMNACDKIFSNANKLLCRWHISENITKHCRQSFTSHSEFDSFKYSWDKFVKAPTKEKYQKHYSDLQVKLISHPRVLRYLHDTWLNKYEDKFESIKTDKYLSFGNSTTSRVEGQHSKRKLDLEPSIIVEDIDHAFWRKPVIDLSTVGEPEYHKDNRGRPRLKKPKTKPNPKPQPNPNPKPQFFDLNKEPDFDDPFVTKTQIHNQNPHMHNHNPNPPYSVDPLMNNRYYLIDQGFANFLPHITQVQNINGDGNCGFRAVAVCLGHHQDIWPQVRMDLLDELFVHNATYTYMFNREGMQSLQHTLSHFQGPALPPHWMDMSDMGLLIASRYNVVVVFLSNRGDWRDNVFTTFY